MLYINVNAWLASLNNCLFTRMVFILSYYYHDDIFEKLYLLIT